MHKIKLWYFIAMVFASNIFVLEAVVIFPATSHSKIVMCKVAEISINAEYNIKQHDLNLCTHLIYFKMDSSNSIKKELLNSSQFFNLNLDSGSNETLFDRLPGIREQYPNLKICFGVNNLPVDFSEMASDEIKRRQFFENVISFISKYHFNGLDLSWNIPKERFDLYLEFVKGLMEYLEWNRLLLSAKINANNETINNDKYLLALSRQLDLVHLTLDYQIDPPRELYTITDALKEYGIPHFEYAIDKLIEIGIPSSKILAGFDFGGLKLDTAYRTQQYLGYHEICETISNEEWTHSFDATANLALEKKLDPVLLFWSEVIVFGNIRAIFHRIRFAMKRNLAGVMATFINTDHLHGNCKIGNETFNKFVSSDVAINLTITDEYNAIPLLNTINLMMVMSLQEIDLENKLSEEKAYWT